MACVICLVSASSRTMSGARSPSRTRRGWPRRRPRPLPARHGRPGRGVELVELLVRQERRVAGGGAAQLEQAGVPACFGRADRGLSPAYLGGGGFLRRAAAVRVVGDRGVGIEASRANGCGRSGSSSPLASYSSASTPRPRAHPGRSGCALPDGAAGGGSRWWLPSATVWPLRWPSVIASSTVVSASWYSCAGCGHRCGDGGDGSGQVRCQAFAVGERSPALVMSATAPVTAAPVDTVTRRPSP